MKNWKTTLFGCIGAALSFLALYQQNGGDFKDWKLYLIPLIIAVFGAVSKDHNVTGGTVSQETQPPLTPTIHP